MVQPYLTNYRIPVFAELATRFETVVASSTPPGDSGYDAQAKGAPFATHHTPEVHLPGGALWQSGLVGLLLRFKPQVVLITANPRYLSFWAVLMLGRLLGMRVVAHGQGPYNKPALSTPAKLAYKAMLALASAYACYTEYSRQSFARHGLPITKLCVADNSLNLQVTVEPDQKTGRERGVLFIGRLREGSMLDVLVAAMDNVHENPAMADVELHVVGGGEGQAELEALAQSRPWIHLHGLIYDQQKVADISRNCLVGCYPGDAGLSVLHYMALSCPPVCHDDIARHMGPEPSYVEDGQNGLLFNANGREASLTNALSRAFTSDLSGIQQNAYQTYREVSFPSLGQRLLRILEEKA
ncbi:MAG: glycosyltransferase family 4 protein [Okeania sp. SIO3B3]|nr:glycosyltransferase family 4 protein [Okeania sp. SIO3B3]